MARPGFRHPWIAALALAGLLACSIDHDFRGSGFVPPGDATPTAPGGSEGQVRIATFNIETFDANEAAERVTRLADEILGAGAAIVAAQEIRGEAAAQHLVTGLNQRSVALGRSPGWSWIITECGGGFSLHPAVFFDRDQVAVELVDEVEEIVLSGSCDSGLRPGLLVSVTSRSQGGVDLGLLILHLKATFGDDDGRPTRELQWQVIDGLLQSWRSDPERSDDLIILGDFNAVDPGEMESIVADHLGGSYRLPGGEPCSHYYLGRAQLIDGMLLPADLDEVPPGREMRAGGACGNVDCVDFAGNPDVRTEVLDWQDNVSNHCPLYLGIPDLDGD
jgi:endonuclease/exonuclease/phosphatase family metal-dependent hydrolase